MITIWKRDNRYGKMIAQKMSEGDTSSIYQLRRSYVREYKSECPTLTANMGGGGWNVPFVKDRWGIRQLTVEECANLQGFNKKFIFPESVPNKERYKQLGNAVSVPLAIKLAKECVNALSQEGIYA